MKSEHSVPTMKDVAREAGVALGTVSKVVNGIPVGESYRLRVEEAIKKLNYQVNSYAQGLKSNKTYTAALLLPNTEEPFFASLAYHINLSLLKRRYRMLLCCTDFSSDQEQEYVTMAQQNKVDGIIIGTHMLKDDVYETIRLPIVGMDIILGENIPCVHADHQKGGLLAAERLVQAGCRNVLQLSGYSAIHSPALIRHQVFEEVCREHGVNCITHELESNEFKRESYCQIIHSLLDQYPSVDGFFSTDIIVAYALRCAFDRGIKVPEQFKAIGYDGVELARFLTPPLTYIQQPIRQLSEVLVETLLKKINGEDIPEPEIILPDIWLVEGGTV